MKMKSSATLFWLSAFSTAAAYGLKVLGTSPFEFCDADRDEDLTVINKIDIAPNPPKAWVRAFSLLLMYSHQLIGVRVCP